MVGAKSERVEMDAQNGKTTLIGDIQASQSGYKSIKPSAEIYGGAISLINRGLTPNNMGAAHLVQPYNICKVKSFLCKKT